jgi:hypothetical protein
MKTNNRISFSRLIEFAAFCAVLTRERIAFTAWQAVREVEGRDEAYIVITGESDEEGEA